MISAGNSVVSLENAIVFPTFKMYWPKLIIFTIVFSIIMFAIVRVSVAPAPLTPNFRMLYDIIFGSYAEAEAKLDAHIRTAISLQTSNHHRSHKKGNNDINESFVPDNSIDTDTDTDTDVWTSAANKWQSIGKDWINKAFATLFITGHTINVRATPSQN